MHLIKKYILDPEDINIYELLNEIENFKESIIASLHRGEKEYLPNANAKEPDAYKDPKSEQSMRAVMAWNEIFPDKVIELPSKISLLKLTIFDIERIDDLKEKDEHHYNLIKEKIFDDDSGYFVQKTWVSDECKIVNVKNKEWYEKIPKKFRTKYKKLGPEAWNEYVENLSDDIKDEEGHWEINSRGLQVIAIPTNELIPDFIIPYIDYASLINNIMAPFIPVLEIFGIKTLEEGRTYKGAARKSEGTSNIIKF